LRTFSPKPKRPHHGRQRAAWADDLWITRKAFQIAARYDAGSVDAARARLAKIIVSLVADTKDPAEIQAIAVQEMTKSQ
jgi:hypothetical protein